MAKKTFGREELDDLSIDDETNQMYWRGKAIVTPITLPIWVQIASIAAGFGAAATGLVNVIRLCIGK